MIKTLRLFMEPVSAAHADVMFDGLADERCYRFLADDPPESVEKLRARYILLEGQISPNGKEVWLNWMLRRRGGEHYVGYVQATVVRAERLAIIAYQIFPEFWGQRLGREAAAGMLKYLAPTFKLKEARAYIDTRNAPSINVVESLGFQLVDTFVAARLLRGESRREHLYILKLDAAKVEG